MLQLLIESLHLFVALGFGIYAFRYMNTLYRIFFCQLLFAILIFILARMDYYISNIHHEHPNNQWLYNAAMPIETGFLAWAAYTYFKSDKRKYLIGLGYVAFLSAFITEVSINGLNILSNHGYIAESALLLLLFLLIMYVHFTRERIDWKRAPITWISVGIVLYFGGSIPYLSLMHYLQNNHPKINFFLFYFIIEGLANVRYLLLALGFWFVRRNVLSKIHGINE